MRGRLASQTRTEFASTAAGRVLRTATVVCAVVMASCVVPALGQSRDPYRDARQAMVTTAIRQEGVTNERVLAAMLAVPRHEFVARAYRTQAYLDMALPIGHGQTISPPYIVAYMTQTIDPQPSDRVLEIGTGSGYQAAVLSHLVEQVYSIEIVEPLGREAEARLRRMRYGNVHVKVGDGYQGWPEHAPFDKIIVTCSPESVPQPLVDQLREGGQMLIPLGERYQQVFHLFRKEEGKLVQTRLQPTLFVPMTGRSEQEREVLPDPLSPRIENGSFEADVSGDGRPDGWHYQRQARLRTGGPEGGRYLCLENADPGRLAQVLQGLAVDGRRIGTLGVRLHVKTSTIYAGLQSQEKPGLVIHFYDETRRPVGEGLVGPWLTNRDWTEVTATVAVPPAAREAIVQLGLNGATGELCVDDLRIVPRSR